MTLRIKSHKPLKQELPAENLARLGEKFAKLRRAFVSAPYNGDSSKVMYSGSPLFSDFYMVYLAQKYKNRCTEKFMENSTNPDEFLKKTPLSDFLYSNVKTPKPNAVELAAESLLKCIRQPGNTFVIPFVFSATSSFIGHANLLVFRKNFNTLEHFEPHGQYMGQYDTEPHSVNLRNRIEILLAKVNESLAAADKIKYITPADTCPSAIGPQAHQESAGVANNTVDSGLCVMWSMFIAVLALENPGLPTQQIVDELLDYSAAVGHGTYPKPYVPVKQNTRLEELEFFKTMGNQATGRVLREIIVGFIISIQKELDHFVRLITLKSEFHDIKTMEQFVDRFNRGGISTQLKLSILTNFFILKHGSELVIDKLINDIPVETEPAKFSSIAEYKAHIEANIVEAKRRIAEIEPQYTQRMNELEELRSEHDKLKKSFFEKIRRTMKRDDKSNKYRQFKAKYKEMIPLGIMLQSLRLTINANEDILDTIEDKPERLKNSPVFIPKPLIPVPPLPPLPPVENAVIVPPPTTKGKPGPKPKLPNSKTKKSDEPKPRKTPTKKAPIKPAEQAPKPNTTRTTKKSNKEQLTEEDRK
jgi:hypothetical protein